MKFHTWEAKLIQKDRVKGVVNKGRTKRKYILFFYTLPKDDNL